MSNFNELQDIINKYKVNKAEAEKSFDNLKNEMAKIDAQLELRQESVSALKKQIIEGLVASGHLKEKVEDIDMGELKQIIDSIIEEVKETSEKLEAFRRFI